MTTELSDKLHAAVHELEFEQAPRLLDGAARQLAKLAIEAAEELNRLAAPTFEVVKGSTEAAPVYQHQHQWHYAGEPEQSPIGSWETPVKCSCGASGSMTTFEKPDSAHS